MSMASISREVEPMIAEAKALHDHRKDGFAMGDVVVVTTFRK